MISELILTVFFTARTGFSAVRVCLWDRTNTQSWDNVQAHWPFLSFFHSRFLSCCLTPTLSLCLFSLPRERCLFLSVTPRFHLSVYQSVCLSVCLYVCVSVRLFV